MPQPYAVVSRTGQAHHEAGPVLSLAFHLNPAAVQVDDAMDGGKPQSRPFLFRREKWKKNLI